MSSYPLDKWIFALQCGPRSRTKTYVDIAVEQEFEGSDFDVTGYFNIRNFLNTKGQVYENGAVQRIPVRSGPKGTDWPPSGLRL